MCNKRNYGELKIRKGIYSIFLTQNYSERGSDDKKEIKLRLGGYPVSLNLDKNCDEVGKVVGKTSIYGKNTKFVLWMMINNVE